MPMSKQKDLLSKFLPVFFLFSFLVWLFMWKGFLTGKNPFQGDAVSYYEHIRFFIKSISRGVYPLWDPFWNCGVPNSFFLRRMGEFNPFFFLIVLFNKAGLRFYTSYLMFLTLYFFLGMVGFYLLSRAVFNDRRMAFCAYLLLMFSSFPSILFQSFIILIFVPMVWFFYFLFDFFDTNHDGDEVCRRRSFWGMVFCLMVIVTTYLPFYFLTVFLSFLVLWSLMYPSRIRPVVVTMVRFARRNRLLVCIAVLAVLLAVIPGVLFFIEAGSSALVLPERHALSNASNVMEVYKQSMVMGGIPLKNIFSGLFSNLNRARLGRFFVPVFVYILLGLSCIVRINKRTVFLSLLMFWMLLIGLYDASPVYSFLYKYVFFFKYFRNFQFFLWLVILPLFVWICVEQFRVFLNGFRYKKSMMLSRSSLFWSVVGIHVGVAVFLFFQESVIWTTYFSLALSMLFFIFILKGVADKSPVLFFAFLFVVVICQPFEVFRYIGENAVTTGGPREYGDMRFLFCRDDSGKGCSTAGEMGADCIRGRAKAPTLYYATRFYYVLRSKMDYCLFKRYVNYPFIVYDNVEPVDYSFFDFNKMEEAVSSNANVAFVPLDRGKDVDDVGNNGVAGSPLFISKNSPEFEVLGYDANMVKVKTNFAKRRFLVYNDSYYKGWQAFINGKKTEILRANFAFKGVWLQPGENVVEFRFGSGWQYFLGYFLLAVFIVVLIRLLLMA